MLQFDLKHEITDSRIYYELHNTDADYNGYTYIKDRLPNPIYSLGAQVEFKAE